MKISSGLHDHLLSIWRTPVCLMTMSQTLQQELSTVGAGKKKKSNFYVNFTVFISAIFAKFALATSPPPLGEQLPVKSQSQSHLCR